MPRIYNLYLKDILNAITRIESYLSGLTLEEFTQSTIKVDATLHNLLIIGEAVKGIPQEVLDEYPQVAWRRIARFRDFAIHKYFAVSLEIVWSIYEQDLPILKETVTKILEDKSS